jgi:hypothetical protein
LSFFKELAIISKIPEGMYCYDGKGVCPYWSINENYEYQDNGYCSYLKQGDWEGLGGLLWDQCKACGINDEFDIQTTEGPKN